MYKDLLILCSTVGVKLGEACTIVLRGATKQILDEADRSIHDAQQIKGYLLIQLVN
jgi:T-complex protein 1 subunit beta